MFQRLHIRWIIILGFLSLAVYFINPTYQYYSISSNPELNDINIDYLKDDALKLGLDLQGGLYIVLELDYKSYLLGQANKTLTQSLKKELENDIDSAIKESLSGQTDVLDELFNISANAKLAKFYSSLLKVSPNSDPNNILKVLKDKRKESMTAILDIMRNRIENHNQYGVGEPSIQRFGSDRLVIELAGVSDVSNAKEYIQRTAEFELTLVHSIQKFNEIIFKIDNNGDNQLKLQNLLSASRGSMLAMQKDYDIINLIVKNSESFFNDKYQILWDNNTSNTDNDQVLRRLYLVNQKSAISGGEIKEPKALISEFGNDDAGKWIVNLDMTKAGKVKWSRFTGNNIGNQVAIVLDKKVFMAPTIQNKISSGGTRITGFANKQEAQDIAAVLKAGELPAPIKIAQINYIGPSLGKDSIDSGWKSMIFGILIIFIFMIIYYNISGLLANLALLINMILVLGILISMEAVLTLPGIAGLLLTVGMSVDANIIIFERIREELRIGSKVKAAINNGYNRAFITIFDANVTTLLTAFVLSFIGSGPIKGFATTLSVGILCSMFSAVFITRTIFLTLSNYISIKKLSI
ncbi:MAG: protein translocase subunit SecD [Candidatus Marinimicrobia bacterium]|nr:protein translocase subunit SecD [Candidatus Neomarinimicrobiota bacterium]